VASYSQGQAPALQRLRRGQHTAQQHENRYEAGPEHTILRFQRRRANPKQNLVPKPDDFQEVSAQELVRWPRDYAHRAVPVAEAHVL